MKRVGHTDELDTLDTHRIPASGGGHLPSERDEAHRNLGQQATTAARKQLIANHRREYDDLVRAERKARGLAPKTTTQVLAEHRAGRRRWGRRHA